MRHCLGVIVNRYREPQLLHPSNEYTSRGFVRETGVHAMYDKNIHRPSRDAAELFVPAVLARADGVTRARGFSHFALGIRGRGAWPNIELFDEPTDTHLALNGRSLRPVRRESWNRKNLTDYVATHVGER